MKPLLSYLQSYLLYAKGQSASKGFVANVLRIFVLICTFGPVQALRCFQAVMLPLCRMERARSKVILIQVMVPLLQIEMSVIELFVNNGVIKSIGKTTARTRGYRWMGCLYCVDMMFIAVATGYVYQACDLLNWKQRQTFQWIYSAETDDYGATEHAGLVMCV